MKILKNPVVEVALSLLIIFGSSFLSAKVRLNNEAQEVMNGFYTGIEYEGYKHNSIHSQLENICGAVSGLMTTAKNNKVDTSELATLNDDLHNSISDPHSNIASMYPKYSALMAAFDSLVARLETMPLNERDQKALETYSGTVKGANMVIRESGYNDSVRSYINDAGALKKLFMKLTSAKTPEMFC